MKKRTKNIALLREALSQPGIVPLHQVDQPLVASLCEVIKALAAALKRQGKDPEQSL